MPSRDRRPGLVRLRPLDAPTRPSPRPLQLLDAPQGGEVHQDAPQPGDARPSALASLLDRWRLAGSRRRHPPEGPACPWDSRTFATEVANLARPRCCGWGRARALDGHRGQLQLPRRGDRPARWRCRGAVPRRSTRSAPASRSGRHATVRSAVRRASWTAPGVGPAASTSFNSGRDTPRLAICITHCISSA